MLVDQRIAQQMAPSLPPSQRICQQRLAYSDAGLNTDHMLADQPELVAEPLNRRLQSQETTMLPRDNPLHCSESGTCESL
ncbi:hypothetical protein D9M68_991550 [compost metagenome]